MTSPKLSFPKSTVIVDGSFAEEVVQGSVCGITEETSEPLRVLQGHRGGDGVTSGENDPKAEIQKMKRSQPGEKRANLFSKKLDSIRELARGPKVLCHLRMV